jgi:hypothetical protein
MMYFFSLQLFYYYKNYILYLSDNFYTSTVTTLFAENL